MEKTTMSEVRYNFVLPKDSKYPVSQLTSREFDDDQYFYSKGELIWGLQTFKVLRGLGLPVSLSCDLDPAAVNLAHGNVLRSLKTRWNCFCVSLQADFPHFPLAQYHIVQNMDQVAERASYIPHWPQPGQTPRDEGRKGVVTVAYQGARDFTHLDEERLNADLKKHGMTFEILDESKWPNLQQVDLLLGIRTFDKKAYKRKPPTKLLNAWHAGIPFIGGWDSAYSQIGVPGENYIRVSTYPELIASIVQLREDPRLYDNMVSAGKKRSVEFTAEAIAHCWKELLESRIVPLYVEWKNQPVRELTYAAKNLVYQVDASFRKGLQMGYRIPALKRLRDRYYDPVK